MTEEPFFVEDQSATRGRQFSESADWLEGACLYACGYASPVFLALGVYLGCRHRQYRVLALVLILISISVVVAWVVLLFEIGAPEPDPNTLWGGLFEMIEWAAPFMGVVLYGGLISFVLAVIVLRVLGAERRAARVCKNCQANRADEA